MSRQRIKTNTVYTIIGNALILVVIGLMLVMLVIGQSLLMDLQDQFTIQIELQDNLTADGINQVKDMISKIELVDPESILFQDRKSLAQIYKDELEIDADSDLLADALFDALSFKFTDSNINSADVIRVEQALFKIPFVKDVNHIEDLSSGLFDNMQRVRLLGFILSLILSLVLVVLIYNNTRLAIHSERFKIRKMQLVGAIPWFITKPFVYMAIKIAFVSTMIATIIVGVVLFWASSNVVILGAEDIFVTLGQVFAILILISITISILSSYLIVHRYLRMDIDQLYA